MRLVYDYIETEIGKIYIVMNELGLVRVIGQANKSNLFPIIIPCDRVIGKNNNLIGYVGAHTDVQLKLIELEKTFK